jgi:hypothetical protein
MPKKRRFDFKQLQGSASATGGGAHRKDGAGGESPATVNERLNELRQVETVEGLQKKLALAASANQPSVPPELRGILGVPESAPPKPKLGVRLREMRRTPGPAPPKSWLKFQSEWQPTLVVRGGRGKQGRQPPSSDAARNQPDQLLRFEHLVQGRPLDSIRQPSGLVHLTLKRLAEEWHLFDPEDYDALTDIPLRLRLRLISYLGFYGCPIDVAAIEALTAGSEDLLILDLGGLAGHASLTTKKLTKLFEPKRPSQTLQQPGEVAEAWDADDDLESMLSLAPSISRFSDLTHLSLSHPPPTVLWRDLLSMTKNVPRLTHLSLAFWPRPTLTPNLATATVSSPHSPHVRASGSNIYSGLDGDFTEPAALLRQLSHSLLCLEWLDLEGCAHWVPALGLLANHEAKQLRGVASEERWSSSQTTGSAVLSFTNAWKNLKYMRCAQGWLPTLAGIDTLGTAVDDPLKSALLVHVEKLPFASSDDPYEVEKRKARMWVEAEQTLLSTAMSVNAVRRYGVCKPITFDYGWRTKT